MDTWALLRHGMLLHQHVNMTCGSNFICANFCKVFSTTGWDSVGRIIASKSYFVFSIYSLNMQHFAFVLPENSMDPSNLRCLRAEFLSHRRANALSRMSLAVGGGSSHPWPLFSRCQQNSSNLWWPNMFSEMSDASWGAKSSPPPIWGPLPQKESSLPF